MSDWEEVEWEDEWGGKDDALRREGWRGEPLLALAERFAAIPPAIIENSTLRLVCGTCGRVLDKISNLWRRDDRLPIATGEWASSPTGPAQRGIDGRVTRQKPSIGRRSAAGPPDARGWRAGLRQKYDCHKRCGASYSFRTERLTVAYLEALEHGRNRITAGVDL